MGHIEWDLSKFGDPDLLNISALAQRLGMSRQGLTNLLNAREMKKLDGRTLAALCNFLGCSPGELLRYIPPASKDAA